MKDRRAKAFARVYSTTRGWGGRTTKSGPGSDPENTEGLRAWLPRLLVELEAETMLDLGCGERAWQRLVDWPCPVISMDVVPNLGDVYGDGVEDELPRCDVVLCRDVLTHLPTEDGASLVDNVKRSGARYLVATTWPYMQTNPQIAPGKWAPRNMEAKPFELGKPVEWTRETVEGKYLAAWAL